MNSTSLDIAFCINDDYVQYICVTIKSILENAGLPVNIHVIIDKISIQSQNKLKSLIPLKGNSEIKIHLINDQKLLGLFLGSWPIQAWYRILLPDLLPNVERVLYLDADTLCCGDLHFLKEYNLENVEVAGVVDSTHVQHKQRLGLNSLRNYVCSGVLLMNLNLWREQNTTQRIILWAKTHKSLLVYPDQDSINSVCSCNLLPLPYGITAGHYNPYIIKEYKQDLINSFYNPHIIHFADRLHTPWFITCNHYSWDKWIKYKNKLKFRIRMKFRGSNYLIYIKTIIWNLFYDRTKCEKEEIMKFLGLHLK